MAQLKPKRNRRPLNVRQQFQPPLVVVQGSSFVHSLQLLTLSLDGPVFGPLEDVEWEVVDEDVNIYIPSLVYFDETGPAIKMEFSVAPIPISKECTMVVPAWSPAWRTNQGGYVGPALVRFNSGI